jgi:hypothetical protein
MHCEETRTNLAAYRTGDLTADETAAVETHLKSCPSCKTEADSLQSALSCLDSLPEIDANPRVWENLSNAVDREPRKTTSTTLVFGRWLRLAAAASILAAAVSFGYVAYVAQSVPVATISHVLPGGTLAPGRSLRAGESITAASYTVLTVPEIGTLKLEKGSTLRFDSRRRVTLESGNVFAEIIPSGKGFEIRTDGTTVTVHGTRFGVKAGATPTVYVLEGNVAVDSKAGAVKLTARQMATVGGPAKSLDDESLRWIAQNENPTLSMRATRLPASLTRGGPLTFRLSFESASPAPVLLETLRDLPGRLVLEITDPAGKKYLANLDGRDVTAVQARPAPDNRLRVDVTSPIELDCRVTIQNGFDQPGRYTIRISYEGSRTPTAPGTVQPCDPFTIEVRP